MTEEQAERLIVALERIANGMERSLMTQVVPTTWHGESPNPHQMAMMNPQATLIIADGVIGFGGGGGKISS